jgi:hypothetical protein
MIITDTGTINFWFSKDKNPNALKKGITIDWSDFLIDSERILISSEYRTFTVIMNPKTEREITLFTEELNKPDKSKHMVTFTWSPKEINLYLDDDIKQSLDVSDL